MAVEGVVLGGRYFLHLIVGLFGRTCRTVHICAEAFRWYTMILTIATRIERSASPSFSL